MNNILTAEELDAPLCSQGCEVGRILIVDDEPEYVSVISKIFTKLGYKVETASGGEEAIKRIMINPPHLMLLDIRLPGKLGGPETLKRVKEISHDTKVIMVSAVRDRDMVKEAYRLGASGYIPKPFDLSCLKTVVDLNIREITGWVS